MTDKEFVLSVHPIARFFGYGRDCGTYSSSSIEISVSPHKYVGWCREKTEEQTWWYARRDIEVEMLRMLES
jgi:hypothetical protein